MAEPHASELEQAGAHYRTAGNGLCLLGGINCRVAVIALASGTQNTFIAYDTMASLVSPSLPSVSGCVSRD